MKLLYEILKTQLVPTQLGLIKFILLFIKYSLSISGKLITVLTRLVNYDQFIVIKYLHDKR